MYKLARIQPMYIHRYAECITEQDCASARGAKEMRRAVQPTDRTVSAEAVFKADAKALLSA